MRTHDRRPLRAALAVAASLSLAACATTAPRAGAVATSRMGVIKAPGVVAASVVQVEAGWTHAERGPRTRDAFGEALLRVGVGRETELRATLPTYLRVATPTATTRGAGDAAVAVKHRLRKPDGWLPAVAVTLGTTLPTGADAVGAGRAQPEGGVAAEWRLPHGVAVVGMAAHRAAVFQGDRFGQSTFGAAARADLAPALSAQLEYSLVSSTRAGAAELGQLRATGAVRLTRDLQLDGWLGRATQDGVPAETQLGIGFTRRW